MYKIGHLPIISPEGMPSLGSCPVSSGSITVDTLKAGRILEDDLTRYLAVLLGTKKVQAEVASGSWTYRIAEGTAPAEVEWQRKFGDRLEAGKAGRWTLRLDNDQRLDLAALAREELRSRKQRDLALAK